MPTTQRAYTRTRSFHVPHLRVLEGGGGREQEPPTPAESRLRQAAPVEPQVRSGQLVDHEAVQRALPVMRFLHDTWFRVDGEGIERVPDHGRVLLVSNHSGAMPLDGAMIVTHLLLRHRARRLAHALVGDFCFTIPKIADLFYRLGARRACPQRAHELLEAERPVLVFPEGYAGPSKPVTQRYRLRRFGRGGAVRTALRARAPIVPCAVVGAEEAMPLLAPTTRVARRLGMPLLPITPTFPWLGPLGLLPYPTKWFIDFGEPLDLTCYSPDRAEDPELVAELTQQLASSVQRLVDRRLARRRSIWSG